MVMNPTITDPTGEATMQSEDNGSGMTDRSEYVTDEQGKVAESVSAGLLQSAGQHIVYLTDEQGRITGADLFMTRSVPGQTPAKTYEAKIRSREHGFVWMERDEYAPGGWKAVQRGQHTQMCQPIVEQAIEYASGRVFGTWP